MRPATFTLVFVVFVYAANAQLTLLPQVGFENARTTVQYNDLAAFVPLADQLSPQFSLRMDYQFRKLRGGPFLGISTSRSIVSYDFTDPENGMNAYTASRGDMQLRLEGGLQMNSKRMYFTKAKTSAKTPAPAELQKAYVQKRCGGGYTSYYYYRPNPSHKEALKSKPKGWYVSVQPSAGVAFIPATVNDITTRNAGSMSVNSYQAGNWNLAFITGAGLEFGKNTTRKVTMSVNYVKGLGNLTEQSIVSTSAAKTVVTRLNSTASAWNVRAGIPITLSKKKAEPKKMEYIQPKKEKSESRCDQYRYKCRKMI